MRGKTTGAHLRRLLGTTLLCTLGIFTGQARAEAPWHTQMLAAASAAIDTGQDVSFYTAYVNADDIPDMIIQYGSVAAGEEIYIWEQDHLFSYLYEYYAFNYIPYESLVDIAGGRMGTYTDDVYRYSPDSMTLAASGRYQTRDVYATPERDENGHFLMNDQFDYTWQEMPVSADQYVAARNAVYDQSRSVSPYDGGALDYAGLDDALTQAEAAGGQSSQQSPSSPFAPADPGNITVDPGTAQTEPSMPAAVPVTGSIGSITGYDAIRQAAANNYWGNLQFVSSDVSDYPAVRLYFSFTDGTGIPITMTDMTAGVKETISGGAQIERAVRYIQRLEGNQGLSIDIVADKSASMSDDLGTMQWIMSQFVQSLDYASGDQAEIISFDSYIMYMCTYTRDVDLLQNGIYNMTPYGGTALYDALVTGINNAANQAGARCVIGFTDGEDNESMYSPQEVISLAIQKEVPVYLIGTQGADAGLLREICQQTGGYYWSISDIADVSQILQEIYRNQKDMYCVCYESDPGADPYVPRTISCVVADDTYIGEVGGVTFQPVHTIEQTQHTSRYEIIRADVTWQQANDACIAKGGHLATITSQAEMDQLSAMAEAAEVKYCWIGGYTSVRDNNAFGHWITGEPFSYTAWYPGEPSRNDTDGTPEFYLMLWNVEGVWSWNDQRNDVIATGLPYFVGKVGYICEYEQ